MFPGSGFYTSGRVQTLNLKHQSHTKGGFSMVGKVEVSDNVTGGKISSFGSNPSKSSFYYVICSKWGEIPQIE